MKTEMLPINVVDDQLVFVLFPVNVFRPKFAAAGLPTNLRNSQLASFFLIRLYFCCLFEQDLKGKCRYKNQAAPRWFLPKENCTTA